MAIKMFLFWVVGQKSGYILQGLFIKVILDFRINHFDPPPYFENSVSSVISVVK